MADLWNHLRRACRSKLRRYGVLNNHIVPYAAICDHINCVFPMENEQRLRTRNVCLIFCIRCCFARIWIWVVRMSTLKWIFIIKCSNWVLIHKRKHIYIIIYKKKYVEEIHNVNITRMVTTTPDYERNKQNKKKKKSTKKRDKPPKNSIKLRFVNERLWENNNNNVKKMIIIEQEHQKIHK